jgi:hypothetical protein
MRAKLMLAAALAVVAAQASAQTSAPAAAPPASSRPQRACFNAHMISSFNAPDDSTVYIRVGVNEVYRLTLFAPCQNMSFDQSVIIQTRSGGSWICDPLDAEIIVHDRAMGPQHCPVTELHKLTPAEVAALPKRSRP